jgi:hypothetical protein
VAPVNAPRSWPKSLGGQKGVWNGGAIHLDEWPLRPPRPAVDGPCDEFLPGAGLAGNEDGGIRGRDLFHAFEHPAHRARLPDDLLEPRRLSELRLELQVLGLELPAQVRDLVVGARIGDRHREGA